MSLFKTRSSCSSGAREKDTKQKCFLRKICCFSERKKKKIEGEKTREDWESWTKQFCGHNKLRIRSSLWRKIRVGKSKGVTNSGVPRYMKEIGAQKIGSHITNWRIKRRILISIEKTEDTLRSYKRDTLNRIEGHLYSYFLVV